jgi:Flp pilus assembly protein TadD
VIHDGGKSLEHRYHEAEASIREYLRLNPDDPYVFNDLYLLLSEQGQNKEAEVALRKAIEIDPNFTDAKEHLRKLHEQKQNT